MTISKLDYLIQNTIPKVYDDSMSFYELLSAILAKLDEVIDDTNLFTDDMEGYVDTQLQKWLDDGTLESLLNHDIMDAHFADIGLSIDNYPVVVPEANDNGRFQRIMADITKNGGGIILLKPNTTYMVNQVVLDNNTKIVGNGATIKQTTTADDATTDNNVIYALSKNNLAIFNLKVNGGKIVSTSASAGQVAGVWLENCDGIIVDHVEVLHTGCDGIAIRSCYNFTVQNCYAHDLYEDGIVSNHEVGKWGQPTKNSNGKFINCFVENVRGDAILAKVPNILVLGCKAIKAGVNNTVRGGGIIVGTDGDIQPVNVTVLGNYVEEVTGAGIYSAGGDHMVISGNQIKNNFNTSTLTDCYRGMELVPGTYSGTAYPVNKAIITGNVVESYNEGIFLHGGANSIVSDNNVKTTNVNKSAILVDKTAAGITPKNNTVINNICETETTNTIGIHILTADTCEVEDNTIVAAYDGIVVENVPEGTIKGTKILNGVTRNGITSKDSSCLIASNKIKGCGTTGIWLRGATNQYTKDNFVTANQVTGCTNGIFADSTVGKNVATGNHLYGNTANINMNIATTTSIGDETNNTAY